MEEQGRRMRRPCIFGGYFNKIKMAKVLAEGLPGGFILFTIINTKNHQEVKMKPQSLLETEFHIEMINIYYTAKEACNYNATRFLQMVSETGGYKTAQKLLSSGEPGEGFTTLWECGRLDLTVEALVLIQKYRALFTEQEIEIARDRLESMGYSA